MPAEKPSKLSRNWGISENVSTKVMQRLDVNQSHKTETRVNNEYFETNDSEKVILRQFDESEEEDEKPRGLLARLSSKVQQFTGNKVIDDQDLGFLLNEIKD